MSIDERRYVSVSRSFFLESMESHVQFTKNDNPNVIEVHLCNVPDFNLRTDAVIDMMNIS
jgi:hypothetical protein